jgi:hypothetical protein
MRDFFILYAPCVRERLTPPAEFMCAFAMQNTHLCNGVVAVTDYNMKRKKSQVCVCLPQQFYFYTIGSAFTCKIIEKMLYVA